MRLPQSASKRYSCRFLPVMIQRNAHLDLFSSLLRWFVIKFGGKGVPSESAPPRPSLFDLRNPQRGRKALRSLPGLR